MANIIDNTIILAKYCGDVFFGTNETQTVYQTMCHILDRIKIIFEGFIRSYTFSPHWGGGSSFLSLSSSLNSVDLNAISTAQQAVEVSRRANKPLQTLEQEIQWEIVSQMSQQDSALGTLAVFSPNLIFGPGCKVGKSIHNPKYFLHVLKSNVEQSHVRTGALTVSFGSEVKQVIPIIHSPDPKSISSENSLVSLTVTNVKKGMVYFFTMLDDSSYVFMLNIKTRRGDEVHVVVLLDDGRASEENQAIIDAINKDSVTEGEVLSALKGPLSKLGIEPE